MGYRVDVVKRLAKLEHDLKTIGIDLDTIEKQASSVKSLEYRVSKLKSEITLYKKDLAVLKELKESLLHEYNKLLAIEDILRRKMVDASCFYCGGILEVPLPSRREAVVMDKVGV
jgi:uncharacterized protein (UPF0335 family)